MYFETMVTSLYLLIIIEAQVGDLLHRKHSIGVTLVNHSVGHALFIDLSIVDFLLQAPVHNEAVDKTRLFLPVSK